MTIRFGALGAARITGRALIEPCRQDPRAAVTVVAARDPQRARDYARAHGIRTVVGSYDEVVEHPDVDAVYIALPIAAHHEWTLRALRAGKHVLCEKSFSANAAEAEEMSALARETGLVLMDAFHYRYHPVFHRAVEIYRSGELGAIQAIEAVFQVPVRDPADIRMNYSTAGGVTMDIGCYPISWVRHITGAEPDAVEARAEVGPPDVDVRLTATLSMPGGIEASIAGDMRPEVPIRAFLTVTGSAGTLHVDNPLVPQTGHSVIVDCGDERREERLDRRATYAYQLDAFLDAALTGAALATDHRDAVRQMQVIDRCYQAAGLPLRGLAP